MRTALRPRSGEIHPVSAGAGPQRSLDRRIEARLRALPTSLPGWWSWLAGAVLLAAGAAVLVHETRGTLFWADEWQWILTRRGGGLHSLLAPHNSHLSLVPVLIYKVLFAVVGLRHYWPYRGVLISADLLCAALVFVYAHRRVGGYYALLCAALILFFGPGWQDILWPFQIAWLVNIAAGVGALLALDREDRAGDLAACLLLGIALASTSAGLALAIGLGIEVLWRRRRRDLWIVAIPLGLYVLWWLGYQQTHFQAHALVLVPRFVFDSAAGTLSALTGVAQINVLNDAGDFLSWGAPLVGLALIAAVWRLRVLGHVPPRAAALGAILLAFWLLTGVGRAYVVAGPIVLTSTGDESRYLYMGAVFAVLLIVELAPRGDRPSLVLGAVVGVIAAAATVSNLGSLQAGARLLRDQASYTQAELATLNLSRPIVAPSYVSEGFIFGIVKARAWFAAESVLGAPPLSPALITQLPEFAKVAADSQLLKIQTLGLHEPGPGAATATAPPSVEAAGSGTETAAGGCINFRPAAFTPSGATNSLTLTVPAAGLLVRTGGAGATVGLRRFSTQFLPLGTVAPGASAELTIKPDLAAQPWHAQIAAPGSFTVCSLG